MKIFNKFVLCILLFVSHSLCFSQAENISYEQKMAYPAINVPKSIRQFEKSKKAIHTTKVSVGTPRDFGLAMEPTLRKILKPHGHRTFFVNASYKNINGIDGLLIKTNSRGEVTSVTVQEYKTNGAHLHDTKNSGYQMSKKWIKNSIKKRQTEIGRDIKKLKEDKRLARTKSEARKIGREIVKLEKQQDVLKAVEAKIKAGKYNRELIHLRYKDGIVSITKETISGETRQGIPKIGNEKPMIEFSVLDKDAKDLNASQRRAKRIFLKDVYSWLVTQGYSSKEAKAYVSALKAGQISSATDPIIAKMSKKAVDHGKLDSNSKKWLSRGQKFSNAGFIALTIIQELKAVYDFCCGYSTAWDFVFETTANSVAAASFFVPELASYLLPIFIAIDVVKNAYDFIRGKSTLFDTVTNVVANIAGLIVASIVTGIVDSLLESATFGGATFFLPFISATVFSGTYFLVSSAIKIITKGIKFLIKKYESIREPRLFNDYCFAIRNRYALNRI